MEEKKLIYDGENSVVRLDVYLSGMLIDKSRSFIQGLIEKNGVHINGLAKKSNYKLKNGDRKSVV